MLLDLIYDAADANRDAPAIVHRDERIAFADLIERIERLAAGLADRGIGPGDSVALLVPNSPEFVVALHAITGLGAAAVPLNPQHKHDELEFQFRACGVRGIICDERSVGVCERIVSSWDQPVEIITTGSALAHGTTIDGLIDAYAPSRLAKRPADDVFIYQFSSGSTGRPKRVARTQGEIHAEALGYRPLFGVGPGVGVFCAVPLFHSYGLTCSLLATAPSGATLVLLEDPNPFVLKRHRALDVLERERPEIFPGVPFIFRLLAEAPREADLSSLRLCFSAGIELPREVFDAFLARFGVPIRQLYGSTETGTMAANVGADPKATFASVGPPLPGVDVEVLGEDGLPAVSGDVGELAVRGPGVARGYVDLPELTAEAFAGGRYRTGDLGRIDEAGRVYLTGRKKLLIPVGGYKVDPIEVEDVLNANPAVDEAVVVGVPGDNPGEEIVKAAVVLADACEERELIRYVQEHLANYKVPQLIEFRDEIPEARQARSFATT